MNRGHYNSQIPQNVTIYKANIRDIEEVKVKVGKEKFDVVIDFLSFNVKHLQTSFEYFRDKCIQYIFISSACVFRRKTEDGILLESSPKPNNELSYSIENTNVKYGCGTMLKKLIANIQLSVRISHMVIQEYHLV